MNPPCRFVAVLSCLIGISTTARSAELAWVELLTSGSPAVASTFYEKTLGWSSERVGDGDWAPVLLLRGGRPVAGVAYRAGERMARARARWVGFWEDSARDEGTLEDAVKAAGGRVLEAEHSGAGPAGARLVLLADGDGAVFGVRRAGSEANPVASTRGFWPVMLARDTSGAAKFYRDLFDGEILPESRTPMFAGDFLLATGGRGWAGVQPAGPGGRAGWLMLVGVVDIDATVRIAKKEGARVLREPRVDLIGGRVAVLADPMGGVFGLYELFPDRGAVWRGGGAAVPAADYEVEALSQ